MLDCHFGVAVSRECRHDYFSLNLLSGRLGAGVLRFAVGVCNFKRNWRDFLESHFFRLWM